MSWRLWSIAIFFASDSIGVIWVLASFHVRKLRFSLRRDRSEGSRFVLQMPFITLNNHAHSRDVALHLGLESSMYATDVDGSERLVLGRYFFFFFSPFPLSVFLRLASCTWKGAKMTPFGFWIRSRGGSGTFVGYGKETDLKNLMAAFSSPLVLGIQISPEGAVFSEDRHEEALRFAAEHSLPQFKHLLLPKTGALEVALKAQHGKTAAIYDWTIGYKCEQQQGRLDW